MILGDILELLPVIGLVLWLFITTAWLIALAKTDNSIVDILWGPGIFLVTLLGFLMTDSMTTGSAVILAMIGLWSGRLSGMIAIRNAGKPEDRRYAAWRKDWGANAWWRSYLSVFVLQAALMVIIALTPLAVFVSGTDPLPGWLMGIGILLYAIGLTIEAVADWQMYSFKQRRGSKGKLLTSGLWAYSRHPNYFGEALLWFGLGLVALPAVGWWAVIAPGLILVLVRFVSGVPKAEEHYAGRTDFAAYQQRTNAFIPGPRRG